MIIRPENAEAEFIKAARKAVRAEKAMAEAHSVMSNAFDKIKSPEKIILSEAKNFMLSVRRTLWP